MRCQFILHLAVIAGNPGLTNCEPLTKKTTELHK